MALVLKVQRSGYQCTLSKDIERIEISEFLFHGYPRCQKIPHYMPNRFLKCIHCQFDEFTELHVNYFACAECEQIIQIIPQTTRADL